MASAEQRDEVGRMIKDDVALGTKALQLAAALAKVEADDGKDTALLVSVRDAAGAISLRVRIACNVEEALEPR